MDNMFEHHYILQVIAPGQELNTLNSLVKVLKLNAFIFRTKIWSTAKLQKSRVIPLSVDNKL